MPSRIRSNRDKNKIRGLEPLLEGKSKYKILSHNEELDIRTQLENTFSSIFKKEDKKLFSEKTAIDLFDNQIVNKYLIITPGHSFKCEGDQKPSFSELQLFISQQPVIFDTYISHVNFKWFLLISHEFGEGPYFYKSK